MLDQRVSLLKGKQVRGVCVNTQLGGWIQWEFIFFGFPTSQTPSKAQVKIPTLSFYGEEKPTSSCVMKALYHFLSQPLGAKQWACVDPLDILSQP